MSRRRAALCLGTILALTVAGSASAGKPGVWSTVVAGANGPTVSQELGIARASSGELNVAWTAGLASVHAVAISPAGQVGSPSTIVSGWSLGADPTLLAEGSGVRAFFGAVIPTQGLLTTAAGSGRGPWTSPSVVENAEFSYGRTPGVTRAPDGTPIETWYSSADIVVHRGLSPGGTVTIGSGGTNTRPDIVTDASGAVLVAWCQFGGGSQGVLVRPVDPATGSPGRTRT